MSCDETVKILRMTLMRLVISCDETGDETIIKTLFLFKGHG